MSSSILKIVEYLNTSLGKAELNARLQIGKKTRLSSDGIYFYHTGDLPVEALQPAELQDLVTRHAKLLDPGALSAIEEFSVTNTRPLNMGARYIPLEKCVHVAQFLGVDI